MEILKERYSITELAEMLQLTDHALRFYEKECELSIPKDERGRRYYTTDLANVMYKIKLMRSEGLEIKAIKKILQDDNIFGQPVVIQESSNTSVIPAAGKEYEAMQVIFTELGRQLTKEISYELDNTREHLIREISKSKLELGACVENSVRRLESKMERHYEQVDNALSRWREKKKKPSVKNAFKRMFGTKM
ncbi:MAG: MerR family transcriptional regulator [Clostridiaceae bacterium]|nr:MerR family transcriptional regulator [Clostridiaceae bacterium]